MNTVNPIDEHQEGEFYRQYRSRKVGSGFYASLAV